MIERKSFSKLFSQLDNKQISILIGARQVGKSTLMEMIKDRAEQPCTYINLENPEDLAIFEKGYNSFIKEIDTKLIFIDEFHYYKNITSVFKAVYDIKKDIKIYASGSSSIEIHKHLKESLAGRKKENIIYSLDFLEWLKKFNIDIPDIFSAFKIKTHNILIDKLEIFLKYGTMPGIISIENDIEIREYLNDIYSTYIMKDIKSLIKEESILGFNKLTELIVLNNAQMLNINNISAKVNVSTRQVNKHIDIMENTYIIKLLRPLYNNRGKELSKMPKVYFYDTGIANNIIKDFRGLKLRHDKGHIIENFVFWEIIKSLDIRYDLHYWRTKDGDEVDFILSRDKEYLPIEVKSLWDKNSIPKGLRKFFVLYPEIKKGVILTQDTYNEYKIDDKIIYIMPWYYASQLKALLN